MAETLVTRIERRLAELNLSASQASKNVSRNRDLIRTVLRKGDDANPTRETIELIARALNVSEDWLLTGTDQPAPNVRPSDATHPARAEMNRDIPVLGTVAAAFNGQGAFQMTSDVVDYVARAPGIARARDVYALYVEGESMEPRYFAGDLVYVSPHVPVRINDVVVIQEPDSNNGAPRAFIKVLKRRTAERIITEQYNPGTTLEFVVRPGITLHKVLANNELYGI